MRIPTVERQHPIRVGGTQRLYRFPNGYGASVVRFAGSYRADVGLWELAVTRLTGEGVDDYKLACDTPITWDAECLLNDDEVDALLAKIEALPPSSNNPAERRQYEGEVLRVEQSGFGVRLYLTDVRRKHQPRCDDNKAAIEITMPIAAATRVVVTVDAR